MTSVPDRTLEHDGIRWVLCVSAPCWPPRSRAARRTGGTTAPADPRVGLKAGPARRRRGRPQHGARREPAEARGLLRSEGARRASRRTRAPPHDDRPRPRRTTRAPPPGAAGPEPAAAAAERPRLRELRPRVQGRPSVRRQLPRLQHLRHRGPEEAAADRLGRVPRRPGRRVGPRQPAVHVGRADARPASTAARRACRSRSAPSGSAASASSTSPTCASRSRSPRCRPAAARTRTRWSPTRTTRRTSTSTDPAPARCARREELAGCSAQDPKDDPNTALFSIDVIQVPLAAPEKARDRQPPAHLRRSDDRRDRRAVAGRRSRAGHAELARDQPVPRHHGLPGDRPRGGRLLGQRHPARHLRSGESRPARPGHRQELRLLALGDVQQRRHEGDLHRRVGRRHAAALPRDRSADLGRQRHLRHRRSQAAVRRLLQDAGAADRAGELRRAQRLAHSGARAATSWCRRGIRAASRCSTSPTRRKPVEIAFFDRGPIDAKQLITGGYWSAYWYNGHIYGAEIARGLDVFKLTPSEYLSQNEIDAATLVRVERVQRAAAAADRLAGDGGGRARLPRSADAQQEPSSRSAPRRSRPRWSASINCGRRATAAPPLFEQLDALAVELEREAGTAEARDAAAPAGARLHHQRTHRFPSLIPALPRTTSPEKQTAGI